MEKPADVSIVQISAVNKPDRVDDLSLRIFGLGSDGMLYEWERSGKEWRVAFN